MEKKSSVNDIHKVIQKDLVELHKTLCNKLGANNPFAKFSIGGGFYLWSDSRCQWRQMIQASSLEQSIVRAALLEKKNEITEKLGEKTAEVLFTIPDDGYVYYSNDGDELEILLTGWGFKKPVQVNGRRDNHEIERPNPVDISFSYDGQVLENYEFGIELPKQTKHMRTGLNGIYHFDNLKVGENFTIVDFETGRHFYLTVNEGQTLYNYDVTKYSHIDIYARQDDAPLCGESIEVAYNGKTYNVVTGPDGRSTLNLPWFDGANISAILKDQTINEEICPDGNQIYLNFNSHKEPQNTYVKVYVKAKGSPLVGERVSISYAGNNYEGVTDSNGAILYQVPIEDAAECSVEVQGCESQCKPLVNGENVFSFEKNEDLKVFTPYIFVKRSNGSTCSNYPVTVQYRGVDTEYISDENGVVCLPEMEADRLMRVVDGKDKYNSYDYILDANQLEYILYVADEITNDIKVTILDIEGKPFKQNKIHFRQNEVSTELLVTLDDEGSATISNEAFLRGKDLIVTILDNERKFMPITFTLEEGENEYLLQETTKNSPWWIILLQILAILVTIVAAILVWPYIVELINGLFDSIYN